jgi:hypothetical protein
MPGIRQTGRFTTSLWSFVGPCDPDRFRTGFRPAGHQVRTATGGYGSLSISYTPVTGQGQPGTPVTADWNLVQNRAI